MVLCAKGQTLTITHATVIDTVTGKIAPDTTVISQMSVQTTRNSKKKRQ
jgi:hypothetical protein